MGNLAESQKPYTRTVSQWGVFDDKKGHCSKTAFWKKLKFGM